GTANTYSILIASKHSTLNATGAGFLFAYKQASPDATTLSLHDALPICDRARRQPARRRSRAGQELPDQGRHPAANAGRRPGRRRDRKSTRLNSSHDQISYAVFCLKKKKQYDYVTASAQAQHALVAPTLP